MAQIFVSYARSTESQAQLIAETLRGGGHGVWIDDQLLAHRSFTDAIEEQVEAADAVVVVWSAAAARSEWVRSEASRARKANKLVQVRTERCQLPMPYDQIHCVDLSSWSGDYEVPQWRAVLASLAAVTGAAHRAPALVARAGGADRPGERRQVTALFCDLADSGSLAARLDPEDMMQVLDVYQAACDDIIAQHGGAMAKYMGHGALAYFGYPRGDEEEAANAVRAGLDLRDAVAGLDLPPGVTLRPRVGVATGLVVISELLGRGQERETGIVGETPNLAAQLESVAAPGAVVVAEATRRITEGLFTFRDLGGVTLAGYDAPLAAFEAVDATDLGSRSQARAHGNSTRLFGRERELAQMSEAWDVARQGEGQVILLQGEAGIGKSSLVNAFRRRVDETSNTQITFYCAPNYSESALHPVSELFTRAAGFEHADIADTRREKLGRLLDRYGATGRESHAVLTDLLGIPPEAASPTEAVTPDRRKAATLATLLAMMDVMSEDQPALFVFEDLHWADPTTLELLDQAIRRAADRSWLILGAARPEFEAGWSDHADVTHIQLGRLGKGDATQICLSLGAEALLSPDVMRQIIARSDGIPLFVEEMTKSVLESLATAPTAENAAKVTIPNTLHDSLVARLDRLGSAKPVASLGATIGRRFGYELLAAVAPQPAAELRQALRELTKSGILERSGTPPNSHYLFKHALIRDAAYESLLKREREALHGRIATALRDRFPETRLAEPALVAYHLTESGAIDEAIPLWMEAGQRAASRAAHAEAVSYLQTALDLLRRLPPDPAGLGLELQLLLGLAVSLSGSRGYAVPEVGDALARARAICDMLGEAPELFGVFNLIGTFSLIVGDVAAAEKAAHTCVEIGERTGDPAQRITSQYTLGYILWMKGELSAARSHLEQSAALYRESDGATLSFVLPQDPLCGVLTTLMRILEAIGDEEGLNRTKLELISHARHLGVKSYSLAYGLVWLAMIEVRQGNYGAAQLLTEESMTLCEENGYETYRNSASLVRALAIGLQGDLANGIELAKRGLEKHRRLGMLHIYGPMVGELAELHVAAGDLPLAAATLAEAIEHSKRGGDAFALPQLHLRRGEILGHIPGADPADARAELREALSVAESQGATAVAARARARLTELVT